jgi:hypothetical protein
MLHLNHLPNPIPDEKIVHVLHRHPLTIFWLVLGYILLLSCLPFLAWYLPLYQPELVADPALMPLAVLGGSAFFLFAWLFLFQNFMDYYLDVWIVTTKRVLNIEQTGLFARTVSELRLYRVQDVTSTVKGVMETLFDFGDVEIQTAGEKTRFIFEQIPHPNRVSKSILELSEIERREQLDEAVSEFGMPDKPNHPPTK